jgi:quercetin dioxygenase-like cupin family protein
MQKITWDSIQKERISDHIARQMYWGEHIMAVRWELAPNSSLPEHEHVSEQLTTVEEGSVTLIFSKNQRYTLAKGELLLIPSSKPHSVEIGADGCVAVDYFSPIRKDFIEGRAMYLPGQDDATESESLPEDQDSQEEAYKALQEVLRASGITLDLATLKEIPLETLGRYAFERECLSMGQLRRILGMDKKQAKELLRQWKHGDDHSQASYEKMLKTFVMLPDEMQKK